MKAIFLVLLTALVTPHFAIAQHQSNEARQADTLTYVKRLVKVQGLENTIEQQIEESSYLRQRVDSSITLLNGMKSQSEVTKSLFTVLSTFEQSTVYLLRLESLVQALAESSLPTSYKTNMNKRLNNYMKSIVKDLTALERAAAESGVYDAKFEYGIEGRSGMIETFWTTTLRESFASLNPSIAQTLASADISTGSEAPKANPKSLAGQTFCRTVELNGMFGGPSGERTFCLKFGKTYVEDNSNTAFGNPPTKDKYTLSEAQVTIGASTYELSQDGTKLTYVSAEDDSIVYELLQPLFGTTSAQNCKSPFQN